MTSKNNMSDSCSNGACMNERLRGLAGRVGERGRPHTPWVSRDYANEMTCYATQCPVNRNNFCSMPSAVKIGPDMKCITGADFIANPTVTKTERPIDGD